MTEGCNYTTANVNKTNLNFPELKDRNSIKKMLATQKSQYIEKVLLAKLKIILSQRSKENWSSSWNEFIELFNQTYCALGNDTIDFLSKVNLNSDEEIIMKTVIEDSMIPVIRKRLKLIALLKDYVPKNKLENAIIKKIRYYPAINGKTFWQDEFYKGHLAETMLINMRIGPLNNNSYIYIRCYGFDNSNANIPNPIRTFEASDELNGLVLAYFF
jgi:hypothetical protein